MDSLILRRRINGTPQEAFIASTLRCARPHAAHAANRAFSARSRASSSSLSGVIPTTDPIPSDGAMAPTIRSLKRCGIAKSPRLDWNAAK